MKNKIICLFKGHAKPTKKRIKEIDYAISMYGYDAWGNDALSNIKKMEELEREKSSCTRCGGLL